MVNNIALGNRSIHFEIDSNNCWNVVNRYSIKSGHSRFYYNGKLWLTHRLVYITYVFSQLSDSDVVMHKCDNGKCINPQHLTHGSQTENIQDMDNKGRRVPAIGVRNTNAKLSEDDISKIREWYRIGFKNQYELANIFRVKQNTIFYIVSNRTWTHVN